MIERAAQAGEQLHYFVYRSSLYIGKEVFV